MKLVQLDPFYHEEDRFTSCGHSGIVELPTLLIQQTLILQAEVVTIAAADVRDVLSQFLCKPLVGMRVPTKYGPGALKDVSRFPKVDISISGMVLSTDSLQMCKRGDCLPINSSAVVGLSHYFGEPIFVWKQNQMNFEWSVIGTMSYNAVSDSLFCDIPYCESANVMIGYSLARLRSPAKISVCHSETLIPIKQPQRYLAREGRAGFLTPLMWAPDTAISSTLRLLRDCSNGDILLTNEEGKDFVTAWTEWGLTDSFKSRPESSSGTDSGSINSGECIEAAVDWLKLRGGDGIMEMISKSEVLNSLYNDSSTSQGKLITELIERSIESLKNYQSPVSLSECIDLGRSDGYPDSCQPDILSATICYIEMLSDSPAMMKGLLSCYQGDDFAVSTLPNYVNHFIEAFTSDPCGGSVICPAGDPLDLFRGPLTNGNEIICDGCDMHKIDHHDHYFGCTACDFHLCAPCTDCTSVCAAHREHLGSLEQVNGIPIPPPPPFTVPGVEAELVKADVPVTQIMNEVHEVIGDTTQTHRLAVRSYTGSWVFAKLNKAHRESMQLDDWKNVTGALLEAVACIPVVTAGLYYRGQQSLFGKQYTVGSVVDFGGFTSVSLNRYTASRFASNRYLFEIQGVPFAISASISKLSFYPNEEEVLIAPGAKFEVTEVIGSNPQIICLRYLSSNQIPQPGNKCMVCQFERYLAGPRCCERLCLDILKKEHFANYIRSTNQQFSSRMIHHYKGNAPARFVEVPTQRRPWLYLACKNNMPEVARRLLQLGARVEDRIACGSTALHIAAIMNWMNCVVVLLSDEFAGEPDKRRALVGVRNNIEKGLTAFEETGLEDIKNLLRQFM
jgi:hypothetical protein